MVLVCKYYDTCPCPPHHSESLCILIGTKWVISGKHTVRCYNRSITAAALRDLVHTQLASELASATVGDDFDFKMLESGTVFDKCFL